jgi:Undecaprenyl-phosphate glucose phosphotransferase
VAGLFFYRAFSFSRLHMLLFGMMTSVLMVGLRLAAYAVIKKTRRKGGNLRRVLIVGAGKVGRRLEDAFRNYPLLGFDVIGFADDEKSGPDILCRTDEVDRLVDDYERSDRPVHAVYIALPLRAAKKIETVVGLLSNRLAHVCLVPELFQFDILNSRLSDVAGLPVIHLIDEPPLAFSRIVKRTIDIAFAFLIVIVLSPLFLLIAVLIKLTSRGPVLYRQTRMGLNGHTFEMLKFRSMPVAVESETGPVWAKAGEKRATGVGSFLRRTSLDELPQFVNVLKGDMSVVGPRPERPFFIERFRERVPRYMQRHKMKAGITGWAQVHGLRGDTSIEKRIEYDLYYIQNWSLSLDLKIMWMTIFKGLVSKHAY